VREVAEMVKVKVLMTQLLCVGIPEGSKSISLFFFCAEQVSIAAFKLSLDSDMFI
jgi:hypothetical protein